VLFVSEKQPTRLPSGGANQFAGGTCTRKSPAPFTAHFIDNQCDSARDYSYNPIVNRTGFVILVVLACLSHLWAQGAVVERRKAETTAKADKLFVQRYTAVPGKPLRAYDEETETGPPDAIIYWHGSSYVIELIFASDGTIARLILLPEALLHSRYRGDVPNIVELSPAEMQWLVASANDLQPLGKADEVREAPDGCFQSGPNLYCADTYELAIINHYHTEEGREEDRVALRDIEILYKQFVNSIVEDVRVEGSEHMLKVGGQWYHGEKPGVEIFDKAQKGSVVRFITYGCTANEKACTAVPAESKSTATE
jgi:hypothetical protein